MSLLAINHRQRVDVTQHPKETRQEKPSSGQASGLAVIVTCHAPYLPFLAETLASINTQSKQPAEKVIMLDDCKLVDGQITDAMLSGWRVFSGSWHNPNPARNLGWRSTSSPWCIFWDADDIMPVEYVAAQTKSIEGAGRGLGIIYPTLTRGDYEAKKTTWVAHTPEWDYWEQRQRLHIQSGAAWSRAALLQAGGWDDGAGVHDDGNLAARITALGFTAQRLSAPVVNLRSHALGHRWVATDRQRAEDLWRFCTLAIVLPIARPQFIASISAKLSTLQVPKRTSLVIVDNTPKEQASALLPVWNLGRFESLQIIRVAPYTGDPRRNCWERHQQISRVYNTAFASTKADRIFTWEDDVVIPDDAIATLWGHFLSGSKVGGAAGVYESAADYHANRQEGLVCGSRATDRWRSETLLEDAPKGPEEWGFVHLGCSLWAGHALRRCVPHNPNQISQWVEGGDAVMCRQLRQDGWKIILDGRVRCEHLWRQT